MTKPLEGFTIIEVASWTFVPAAGAILSDLGADVIKVEPPVGDPQRQLRNRLNTDENVPNVFVELPNHGKRSVTLDLSSSPGREVLLELCATADVFLTSYLPESRRKLGFDEPDVRAVRNDIVYACGSGWGPRGPMQDVGGFDLAAGWASSGLAYRMTPPGGEPPMQPPAFFDLQGASAIAGATGMALLKRERTGEGSVVDVSLLNVGMWAMGPDIAGAPYVGDLPVPDRRDQINPLTNWYPTRDDRWLYLVLLQSDRYWAELCAYVDATDLLTDDRFVDARARSRNRGACVDALTEVFRRRSLEEWCVALEGFSGVWAPVQSFQELHGHRQLADNGYLETMRTEQGLELRLVPPPMQFDGSATAPKGAAPGLGAHTDEVLGELGYGEQAVDRLRAQGVLG